ncbi:MAG TPA: glycoside hydrolase domain-containing protein, partial [Pedobacter sp.]|uniref:glycoside hydrolase domain-containing protein n=1 Tax=Pedobacter sp. TaxID=1411316 RepID=UPI002BBEA17C
MRIFLLLFLFPGVMFAQNNLRVFQLDPLEKVLKDRAYFVDQPDTIRVAKGETATLQLIIKSKTDLQKTAIQLTNVAAKENPQALKPSQIGFVGYVGLGRRVPNPGRDQLISPSGYFPDPIFTDSTFNLPAGEPQPIWITIPVPIDASPGIYRGSVKISALSSGKPITQNRNFVIKVYPVTITETSLWVTNWIHHTPESLSFLNNGKPVEFYTERYWELIGLIAQRIKGTGQNVVMLPVQTLVQYKIDGDKYSFDFTYLDRMVSIYKKAGVLKRMAGSHVGYRMGDWTSQFGVDVPLLENGKISMHRMSISDNRAKNYLDQFFPALMTHLKLNGLDKNYMQHVSDEPVAENIGSYKAIAAYVKKLIPATKIIDANIGS